MSVSYFERDSRSQLFQQFMHEGKSRAAYAVAGSKYGDAHTRQNKALEGLILAVASLLIMGTLVIIVASRVKVSNWAWIDLGLKGGLLGLVALVCLGILGFSEVQKRKALKSLMTDAEITCLQKKNILPLSLEEVPAPVVQK